MRKIIYILLFPLLWGCDSVLDVEPENAITFTNFFKTEEDFNAMVFQLEGFSGINNLRMKRWLIGVFWLIK